MRMARDRGADLGTREAGRGWVARRPLAYDSRDCDTDGAGQNSKSEYQHPASMFAVGVPITTVLHAARQSRAGVSYVSRRPNWVLVRFMATLARATDTRAQRRLYGESGAESASDGVSAGRLGHWEDRAVHMHPAAAVASVAFAGYAVVCLVVASLGALAIHQLGAMTRWDDRVVRYWTEHRTPTLNGWTGTATKVANTEAIVAVLALAVAVLFVLHYRWDALFLVLAVSLELMMFLTINAVVGRPRPAGPYLGSVPSTSSFPSGHGAAMIALYGGIALLLSARFRARIVGVIAWIFALFGGAAIAFSRVYRAMHHPSDVIVGALLAFVALFIAYTAVRVGRAAAERRRAHAPSPDRAVGSVGSLGAA
jgi:membrane-associated phospholipid phosphatase